jgi:hypothetical protein
MNKVEPMINITPAVLTRLKALQGLHTESATFSESIKMISEEQSKITDELENLGAINNQVSLSFSEPEFFESGVPSAEFSLGIGLTDTQPDSRSCKKLFKKMKPTYKLI